MAANSIFSLGPRGPPMGLIGIKAKTAPFSTMPSRLVKTASLLSLIVSEFQRGCSWLPYDNIW